MDKRPIFDRRSIFFSIMALLLFLGLAAVFMKYQRGGTENRNNAWIGTKQRELANKLRGTGLLKQSAKAYERYLEVSDVSPRQWSNTAYTIGQTYMEAKAYEEALPWLYMVELADPDTGLASQVGSSVIACLERLGHHQAAEYALKARTSMDPNSLSEEAKGDKIVARIGEEGIYLNQINQALDDLPEWIKKGFSTIEKKREFAKHYIAEELLYRKGVKLDYAKDPGIRKRLEEYKRQLVIDLVRKTQIEEKLAIDEEDVRNYYLAHKEEYKDPNQGESPLFDEVKERVTGDYRRLKIQQGYQDLIHRSLSSTDVRLFLENVS